jgi:hypothetical protein
MGTPSVPANAAVRVEWPFSLFALFRKTEYFAWNMQENIRFMGFAIGKHRAYGAAI